jgi:hypothetical protein
MLTRPLHVPAPTDGLRTAERPVNVPGPASHSDWLRTLAKGDTVLVRNGRHMLPAERLTDATPCFLKIGKLKFRRDSGWLVKKQQRNRLRLLLVRNEKEFKP